MKKVLLALLIVVTTGMNVNASTNQSSSEVKKEGVKLSTFCKLIQLGDVDGVKNLIDTGTNVNQKSGGMTPLMHAARQNKVEIVQLLLSRGAKLKTRSDKGLTALDYAERSKATESYGLIARAMNA